MKQIDRVNYLVLRHLHNTMSFSITILQNKPNSRTLSIYIFHCCY